MHPLNALHWMSASAALSVGVEAKPEPRNLPLPVVLLALGTARGMGAAGLAVSLTCPRADMLHFLELPRLVAYSPSQDYSPATGFSQGLATHA